MLPSPEFNSRPRRCQWILPVASNLHSGTSNHGNQQKPEESSCHDTNIIDQHLSNAINSKLSAGWKKSIKLRNHLLKGAIYVLR